MTHYGDLPGALAYHEARANSAWTAAGVTDTQRTAALVRGSASVDGIYGDRFPGIKSGGRSQALAWPRVEKDGSLVADRDGIEIAGDEVPVEVINAAFEFALRELTEPGSTQEDLARGGAIKSVGAGSARVEFADNAPAVNTFQAVDNLLAGLLVSRAINSLVGFLARA